MAQSICFVDSQKVCASDSRLCPWKRTFRKKPWTPLPVAILVRKFKLWFHFCSLPVLTGLLRFGGRITLSAKRTSYPFFSQRGSVSFRFQVSPCLYPHQFSVIPQSAVHSVRAARGRACWRSIFTQVRLQIGAVFLRAESDRVWWMRSHLNKEKSWWFYHPGLFRRCGHHSPEVETFCSFCQGISLCSFSNAKRHIEQYFPSPMSQWNRFWHPWSWPKQNHLRKEDVLSGFAVFCVTKPLHI